MSTTEAGRRTASGPPRDGVSLQAVIDAARRLDELSCARVVASAAEAVHAASKAGQPLGVTPAAILLQIDGSVRLVAAPPSLRYTAPERLGRAAGDRRSEVFALGAVLWEALAHAPLFEGATDEAIEHAVLAAVFRPPSELNANVPAELDAICKRALARDPADRYSSARVMAAEIDAMLGDAGYPESNEQIAAYVARALAVPEAIESDPSAREPSVAESLPLEPVAPVPPHPPSDTLPSLPSLPIEPEPAPEMASAPDAAPPAHKATPSPERGVPSGTLPLPVPVVDAPLGPPVRAGTAPGKAAKTEILGSLSSPPDRPVATAVAQGNPVRPASSTIHGTEAPPMPGRLVAASHLAGAAPAFSVPQAHPIVSDAPIETTRQGPPLKPSPHPPSKPSIANAETLATPQLPPHLAVQPQLDMPPGITVAPSLPPAPLQSADREPGDTDEGSDPAEEVAPPPRRRATTGRESRDVLAGWGWTTDSVRAVDDNDVDEAAWAARASRKRLIVAIGGALAVILVIALIAFAAGGSSDKDEHAASRPSPPSAALVAPSPPSPPSTAAPSPTSSEPAPGPATPAPGADPSSAGPASPESPARTATSDPTSPGGATASPSPSAASPSPSAAAVSPSSNAASPAPGAAAVSPSPGAAAASPPNAASPAPNAAAASSPPNAATASPAPNAVAASRSPTVAAASPAPTPPPPPVEPSAKADPARQPDPRLTTREPKPPRAAETRPLPSKSEHTRKVARQPDAKRPDRASKRPAPDRVAKAPARAEPIDPYATPTEKPDVSPADSYRLGLQQFARGDTTGALATFRSSLSSNPTFAPTWRGLGLVYEKLGNRGQARAAFRRYLQLAPNAGDADQILDRLERLGS